MKHHVKKVPHQIHKYELMDLVSDELDRCGVEMQTQAQFSYELSKYVIGSKNFRFVSLQPEIRLRDEEAWTRAYTLVMKYLQKLEMKTTLATIEREAAGKKIPNDPKFLRRQPVADHLSNILHAHKRLTFQQRVSQFTHKAPTSTTHRR